MGREKNGSLSSASRSLPTPSLLVPAPFSRSPPPVFWDYIPCEQLGRETEWPQKPDDFTVTFFLGPQKACLLLFLSPSKRSYPGPSWNISLFPEWPWIPSSHRNPNALPSDVSPDPSTALPDRRAGRGPGSQGGEKSAALLLLAV